MPAELSAEEFLKSDGVLLDTRSPCEFQVGHIPGSINLPLFSDDQRKEIGICYKQQGQEAAVELGLEMVGPRMVNLVRQAKRLAPNGQVRVYCWRGGMRSGSLCWLLETAGMKVNRLIGGYKSFRKWCGDTFCIAKPIITLGGLTGTGKTSLLHALGQRSQAVLDLEGFANHRGSSYGSLGLPPQPTQEQFENQLALAWDEFSGDQAIWIESESSHVGLRHVPAALFSQMKTSPVVLIQRTLEERLDILSKEYGDCELAGLIEATQRIERRLGGQHANAAVENIRQGDLKPAIAIALVYYDKVYQREFPRPDVPQVAVDLRGMTDEQSLEKILVAADELKPALAIGN